MKRVLFLGNSDIVIYNFRLEIIERLLAEKIEVWISSPWGERIDTLISLGCHYSPSSLSCHGLNPFSDLRLLFSYWKLIRKIRPDAVLTFTIKPNIYGALACMLLGCPCIANITGLGIGIHRNFCLSFLLKQMYRISMRKDKCIFFQNQSNLNYFKDNKLIKTAYHLLPGSGVNLEHFRPEPYPDEDNRLIYVGRIMRDKGIGELLNVLPEIKKTHPKFVLDIVGNVAEDIFQGEIAKLQAVGIVNYHGSQIDVRPFIKQACAIVLPSWHEGMANVLLEASAMGRPVLASRIPGCVETYTEGVTGLGFTAKDSNELRQAIEVFLCLPHKKKVQMGRAARQKVECDFNRQIVVDAYMDELEKI